MRELCRHHHRREGTARHQGRSVREGRITPGGARRHVQLLQAGQTYAPGSLYSTARTCRTTRNWRATSFFTATGEEFVPERLRRDRWFIGSSRLYDVFLLYEADVEKLKEMALTLEIARKLPRTNRNRLVFAPTKYLEPEFLHRYRITFQQLPFQIYEAVSQSDAGTG